MSSALPGPVVAVVGPTAAGKSDLGLQIAAELGGEVVNADSMQLYRGMDIGTAKLPVAERRGVPHSLLDIWDVTRAANVEAYQRLARERIDALLATGRTPVLVGGSGLYVRAALDRLNFPGTDAAVRDRLEAELEVVGPAALHDRLLAADPASAAAIGRSNGRRIVRALEVIELTGGPYRSSLMTYESAYGTVLIGVDRPDLDERIVARVDRMWELGLLEEVRRLEGEGLRRGRTASRALGYAQVLRHLAGLMTEAEARERTVIATRQFARRQRSWFRRDPRITWLPAGDGSGWRRLLGRTL